MIKDLKKKLLELGVKEYDFSILDVEKPDCYHIADTTSDEYAVFYLDERGYRRKELRFFNFEDAGDYLINLIKDSETARTAPPFDTPNLEEDFLLNKKTIIDLINKEVYNGNKEKKLILLKELISILELKNFNFKRNEILEFIGNNYTKIDKNITDEILLFINSY